MAVFQSRDLGRRGRDGDVRQNMNSHRMMLDDTWSSSSKNDCFVDEARTQVATTKQFLNESGTGNSQFFSRQDTTSRSTPILSFDGTNSPQDQHFAPPPGFKRAQAGVSRVGAGAAPVRRPPFADQTTPQWNGLPQPAHLLSEKKRQALKALEGPPPGMPEHLIRSEDRTNLVSRKTQQPVSAVNGRRATASQYVTATSSKKPTVPKRQTKNRLHQLVQTGGVTKSRPGVSAATSQAANTAQYNLAAPQSHPTASNRYLSNGQRRLPPLKLSQHHYRLLTKYAQHHNRRIPFKQGMGLPTYGRLKFLAPGRLEVGIDHDSATQMGNAGPTAANFGGYMQSNNNFVTAQSMNATPQGYGTQQQQYGQNVSLPGSNFSLNFANANPAGGNTGSNQPTAPAMLDDSNFDEAIEAALRALDEEPWKNAGSSNIMLATELNNTPRFAPQQTDMHNWSTKPATGMSNDLMLQQTFQYQSQPTIQQSPPNFPATNNGYSSSSLSQTGYYNTSSLLPTSSMQYTSIPATPLFPAPYPPRPDGQQQQSHRPKPVTRAPCPTLPPPTQQRASHFQQGPLYQQHHQQQQLITPTSSQNTGTSSPIPPTFPFHSSQEVIISNNVPITISDANNSTNLPSPLPMDLQDIDLELELDLEPGEPVHAYANGPIVGRVIAGDFWRMGNDGKLIPPADHLHSSPSSSEEQISAENGGGDATMGHVEQDDDPAGAEEVSFAESIAAAAAVGTHENDQGHGLSQYEFGFEYEYGYEYQDQDQYQPQQHYQQDRASSPTPFSSASNGKTAAAALEDASDDTNTKTDPALDLAALLARHDRELMMMGEMQMPQGPNEPLGSSSPADDFASPKIIDTEGATQGIETPLPLPAQIAEADANDAAAGVGNHPGKPPSTDDAPATAAVDVNANANVSVDIDAATALPSTGASQSAQSEQQFQENQAELEVQEGQQEEDLSYEALTAQYLQGYEGEDGA